MKHRTSMKRGEVAKKIAFAKKEQGQGEEEIVAAIEGIEEVAIENVTII